MRKALCRYKGAVLFPAVAVMLLLSGAAGGVVVTFPDPNLEEVIRIAINDFDGTIDHTQLLEIAALNASYRGIVDLSGIEWCKNITTLQLYGNEIVDISRLANMPLLKDVYLWDNEIEEITGLCGLTQLRFLFLQNNHITDVTCLMNNTSWNEGDIVNLSGNFIDQVGLCHVVPELEDAGVLVYLDDLPVVAPGAPRGCESIRVDIPDAALNEQLRWALDLRDTDIHPYLYSTDLARLTAFVANDRGIKSLNGLEYCVNLKSLNLMGNEISDLTAISNLSLLESLLIGGNLIEDLTPLSEMYALTELGLQGNQISDLTPLRALGQLRQIYLNDNAIEDLTGLRWLLNLNVLTLNSNQISNIDDLSRLTALVNLHLSDNQISDITPLRPLVSLRALMVAKNELTDISAVDVLVNLEYFDASFNSITDISSLDRLKKIIYLYLHNNLIRKIIVLAGLPDLSVVTLANNEISDISPLVANTGLGDDTYGTPSSPPIRDQVDVRNNQLSQENICNDILALRERNVIVRTDEFQICDPFGATYTLTMGVAVPGSGTVDPDEGSHRYVGGMQVKLQATPNTAAGYEFSRWTGDFESTENPAMVTMDSDKQVIAVFAEASVQYTLTIQVTGLGSVSPPLGSHTYANQSQVLVTATPGKGWVFDHWEGALTGIVNPQQVVMNGDKTVRAVFVEQGPPQTLRIYVRGNGTTDPAPGVHQYPLDEHVTIDAIPSLGYRFDHWEGNLQGTAAPQVIQMTGPKSVTAVFVPDGYDYTLAMVVSGGGTTTPAPGYYRHYAQDTVTVTAIPEDDYVFDYWRGALTSSQNPATITMDSDKTLEAVFLFAPVRYTLSIDASPGGTTSPAPGDYLYAAGKPVTIVAIPDVGYVFDRWEGDYGGTATSQLITMSKDIEVQAYFRPFPFLTSVTPDEGSTEGGDTVRISGGRLGAATEVWFDDRAGTILLWSDDELTVVTPSHGRGVSNIVVVTPEGETAPLVAEFMFIEPPGPPQFGQAIPSKGTVAGGDTVLIRGQNLQLTQTVLFGGAAAQIVSSTESRLTVVTPPHAAGVVNIDITTTTGSVRGVAAYSYLSPPQISGVNPSQGHISGGERVTILGAHLGSTSSVMFDGTPATIESRSDTYVVVVAPAHAAGTVDVLLVTPGGAALAESAYNYYSVGATILCNVKNTQNAPITDATVRLDTGVPIIGSLDGMYQFSNLRPGTYEVSVITGNCGTQTRTVTALAQTSVTLNFMLECTSPTPGTPCGSAVKRLDARILESTLPLSVQDAPAGKVACNSVFAVRLGASDPIDPASAWAYVEGYGWTSTGGVWRPVNAEDGRDGWVVYTPDEALPAGQVVTVTVGASTLDGTPVGPIAYDFAIGAAGAGADNDGPVLVEAGEIPALPSMLAASQSQAYRIAPSRVFEGPATVLIPLPAGSGEDVDIYYYSESVKHVGWYPAQNIVGFIEPDTRKVVEVDGQRYVEVQVNHGGVVQLGQTIKLKLGNNASVEIGYGGRPAAWLLFAGALAGLSLTLGLIATRRREEV